MSLFEIAGLLVALSALFGFINYRTLGLPDVIGVTAVGLVASAVGLVLSRFAPELMAPIVATAMAVDFSELILHGMLGLLLFAGSLHVSLSSLEREKWPILVLATVGVLLSTVAVGGAMYLLTNSVGWRISLLHCLIFGALISPTDPIAVLAILKTSGASKKLESRISGESLFNDGTAVVTFLVLLGLITGDGKASAGSIATMFLLEAGGGVLFGLAVGGAALWMLRHVDSYAVEVLITLALATAGYSAAEHLHVSAPLYVVTAGLVIGNLGPKHVLSERTQEHLFPFWSLVDELLNLVLFGLIGLKLLALTFNPEYVAAGFVMVVVVLAARWLSVAAPMAGLQRFLPERDECHKVAIMTWGGLRGAVSIALALSLPEGPEKELLVWLTYVVVLFSILVQATTLGRLIRRFAKRGPPAESR